MRINRIGQSLLFLLLLYSCQGNSSNNKENTLASIKDTKVLQYAIEGKILYENYCANCHQKDGVGLGKLIPPLFESDYMLEDIGRTARIIKYGKNGEIIVNGQIYNQAMPANSKLTNLEIAQIMTYIYNIWGSKQGVIDANMVERYLQN
ncbi:c-type cytochrome [Aquiflexum lacus]|uniref:c-type cytochrome n=1 Tax=Aquiflexum lacus TaxID=2483805 RepID=UPI0018961C53|nr:cytochrome c [Aquiflexum lacus]